MRIAKFCFLLFLIYSCKPTQQTTVVVRTDTVTIRPSEPEVYRAAYPLYNDLVHTKLDVKFDWAKKYLNGQATITLHPHFYPTDSLTLDARGMDIHEVTIFPTSWNEGLSGTQATVLNPAKADRGVALSFTYDSLKIRIKLDRVYKKDENYTIHIDYTSKPDELPAGGSVAITKDKGLYFVNADGSDTEKPRQVWTQGETESNSCWFPTIDDPQQKMTQEIYITVDTALTTVSNGLMITSTDNHDGTRTDYWKQSLPAAPYLTMIAASGFAVVKDKWRNIEVNYYLDKDYEKYARIIFGNTPEMIGFYSNKLGVNYAWEKFSQVVVHDYVSGAMENATAVIHGTNMLQDSIEHGDGSEEDVISHELFHHWFGDLVTCKSWSNITLNEGFATYGEYLWREYKFGRDDADHLLQGKQNIYLMTAKMHDDDLIRFNYDDREDMFDGISYDKGGHVIHMLRKYVGDDAFFAALKFYLEQHKFGTVEVHDLRLAFEKITGEDLNWFFNEWFLNHGHPVIEINYEWDDASKTEKVTIEQKQDLKKNPLYKIPLLIDIYYDGKTERKKITLEKEKEGLKWKLPSKPDLVNVDAERMLLCEKKDHKSNDNLVFQFYHAPLYQDRFEPLNKIATDYEANSTSGKMMEDALKDKYWNVRLQALKNIGTQFKANKERLKPLVVAMSEHDDKPQVRSQAIKTLNKYLKDDSLVKVAVENGLKDSSYVVRTNAFKIIGENDKDKADKVAKQFAASSSGDLLNAVANFYKDQGREEDNDFFLKAIDKTKGFDRYSLIDTYGRYLRKVNLATMQEGIQKIETIAPKATGFRKKTVLNTLEDLQNELSSRASTEKARAEELERNHATTIEIDTAKQQADQLTDQRDRLKNEIEKLRSKKD